LNGFGLALIGADATSLAKIIIDFIAVVMVSHGVIRANFPAFTALIAHVLIDLRPLVPPVAGLVIQGGSTLYDSSFCQFHEVSLAHRRGAECAKVFIKRFSLCVLCVSAVNPIKMREFLNFSHFRSL
jgi:hypothetical protein